MGYETAPATEMVATYCACCSRPLVDAVSVEAGIGPECRKKHGFDTAQGEADWAATVGALGVLPQGAMLDTPGWIGAAEARDAHKAANVLVHHIAVAQDGPFVVAFTNAIRHLGYAKLADRIAKRLTKIVIGLEGDMYVVKTPFSDEAVAEFRAIRGRQWVGERKVNLFPRTARAALWDALVRLYKGQPARGPNGLFTIGASAA